MFCLTLIDDRNTCNYISYYKYISYISLGGTENKLTADNHFYLVKNLHILLSPCLKVALEGVLIWFDNFHHIRWGFLDLNIRYTIIAIDKQQH